MSQRVVPSANSVISVEELRDYLGASSNRDDPHLVEALNATTALVKARTTRNLKEQVYAVPFTVTPCVITQTPAPLATVTGTGFQPGAAGTGPVRRQMDMYQVNLQEQTRVLSVDSNVQITMTKKPNADAVNGSYAITFGSGALMHDGDGTRELLLREWPLTDIYSLKWRDTDGTLTAIDQTAILIDNEAGIVRVPYDTFPAGDRNVILECRAGYRAPSTTEPGHEEWGLMVRLWRRVGEILYRDRTDQRGRMSEVMTARGQAQLKDVALPSEVEDLIAYFAREIA